MLPPNAAPNSFDCFRAGLFVQRDTDLGRVNFAQVDTLLNSGIHYNALQSANLNCDRVKKDLRLDSLSQDFPAP